jgi:pimeloyl-ACP methyl ester carboxylesterase
MITLKLLALHPERVNSAVIGGMGWRPADSPMNPFGQTAGNGGRLRVPSACPESFAELSVTEAELKAIKIPATIVVGCHDSCRQMYVEPLRKVRPDWPVRVIPDAGHLNCVLKPEFLAQLQAALR